MDCVTTGSDLAASPRRKSEKSLKAKKSRVTKSISQSRTIKRATREAEFAHFDRELRRELDVRSMVEKLMADYVVRSAWRFQEVLDRQAGRDLRDPTDLQVDTCQGRSKSALDRAGRILRESLEMLDYARSRRSANLPASSVVEIEPNEWPIVPTDGLDDFLGDPDPIEVDTPSWHDRLIFDFEVSDISPVVKGTWITVGHVVSLIVDGWSWADILRSHPELSEDDIRTCIAYTMAEENLAG